MQSSLASPSAEWTFVVLSVALAGLLCLLGGAWLGRRRADPRAQTLLDGATLAAWSAKQGALFDALQAGFAALRSEAAHHARLGREEASSKAEQTAEGLRLGLHAMATSQLERLDQLTRSLGQASEQAAHHARAARQEASQTSSQLQQQLAATLQGQSERQAERLERLAAAMQGVEQNTERRHEALRLQVEQKLEALRHDNAGKLEEMRRTVDEKLQGTLEQRLGASFALVNANLERVFKSVGEMQSIAHGIGDLKRVLTNVKTRGTWGETALLALLEETLTPEQYASNVEVVPGSNLRVEYAIRLPQDGPAPLWLPIDAKMPIEDFDRLQQAAEVGDGEAVEEAARGLERAIRLAAKEICQKYVQPPHSTDFGVLFLPTESLFAEVMRRPGLAAALQREHRIVPCGPTTLGALLTSLRMGFRTLAIQQRSSEVWEVLGQVKTEFDKFGGALDRVSKKLDEARNTVDAVAVRRRAVDKRLRAIEALPSSAVDALAPASLVAGEPTDDQAADASEAPGAKEA